MIGGASSHRRGRGKRPRTAAQAGAEAQEAKGERRKRKSAIADGNGEEISDRNVRLSDELPRLRADGRAARPGWLRADRRTTSDADVIVINTCSVREHAEEKLYTRLGELASSSEETGRSRVVAVAGCVAQQEGEALLKKSNGHVIDVIVGTQRLKMLPALVEQARRSSRVRRGRYQSVGRRHVPAWDHAPRRSRQGLRHHHRRLQRPLRVLRRAVHARARAHAREGRHPGGRSRGGRLRAAGDPAARADRQSLPGARRSARATSRSCWPRSTTCRASSAFALRARIRGTPARGSSRRCAICRRSASTCTCRCSPARRASSGDAAAAYTRGVSGSGGADSRGHPGRYAIDRYDRWFSGRDADDFDETLSLTEAARYHSMFSFKYSPRPNTLASKRMPDDVPRGGEDARGSSPCNRCSGRSRRELHEAAVGSTVEVLVDSVSRRRDCGALRPDDGEHGGELLPAGTGTRL